MLTGIIYIISACLLWGLIFVVPSFLEGFSSIEVALGRCLAFGIFSVGLLFTAKKNLLRNLSLEAWLTALLLALVVNVIHYLAVVLGLRHANAALVALILGINPVCLAIYGNLKQKNYDSKALILPCCLLTIGLILVNLPPFFQTNNATSLMDYILGIFFGLIGLGTWVWSAVRNAEFFKKYPTMSAGDWATMLGVGAFVWSSLAALIGVTVFFNSSHMDKYTFFSDEIQYFIIGSIVLGLFCSWLASYFWNQGTLRLPLAMAGLLSIFETIFGLIFVYLVEQRMPHILEFFGITIILSGILLNFYVANRSQQIPV